MSLAFPGGCPQRHVPSGTGAAPALPPEPAPTAPQSPEGTSDRARAHCHPPAGEGPGKHGEHQKHPGWHHRAHRAQPRAPCAHGAAPAGPCSSGLLLIQTRSWCVPRAEATEGPPSIVPVPSPAPTAFLSPAQPRAWKPPPEPGLPLSPSIPN